MEVFNDFCPVIIFCGEKSVKVPEVNHHLRWLSVRPEICLLSCPWLFLCQTPSFPVFDQRAESSDRVEAVKFHQRNKNVAGSPAGVVTVPFLQNQCHVPHRLVHKVNLEVGAHRCPPPAAFNWVTYQPRHFRERNNWHMILHAQSLHRNDHNPLWT